MVWQRSKSSSGGVDVVSFDKINATLNRFEETGVLDLFTEKDLGVLTDARLITDFNRFQTDAGVSLQANEAIADLKNMRFKGVRTLLQAQFVGRLLTNPQIQRFLTGVGADPIPRQTFEGVGAITAMVVGDMDEQNRLGVGVIQQAEAATDAARSLSQLLIQNIISKGAAVPGPKPAQ